MNPLYEPHEYMDRYLNRELSADEVLEFEKKLQTDPEFAEAFDIHKITNQVIVGHELIELKKRMARDMSGASSLSGWKLWLGGGLVALSALVLWFLMAPQKKVTPVPEQKNDNTSVELPEDTDRVEKVTKEQVIAAEKINTTCTDSIIKFSCQTRGTCAHSNEGAIEIDPNTIKAGKAPYSFSVNSAGNFASIAVIEGLKPGKYEVFVRDANNCVRRLESKVEVSAVDCAKP